MRLRMRSTSASFCTVMVRSLLSHWRGKSAGKLIVRCENCLQRLKAGILPPTLAHRKPNLCRFQQFPQRPNVIGEPCFHGRGNAQSLVDAAEIVECKPERISGSEVLPLLAESVGQSRHPAHSHTNRKVLALDVAGANLLRVGIADDWDDLR